MPSFNMADYIPVAERLRQAQEAIVQVITEPPVMLTDVLGFIRVTIGLKDGRSATGTASFRLDLTTRSAAATSPIEDCETSAIGRALAFLGYETTRGIASREEMMEVERRQAAPTAERTQAPPPRAEGGSRAAPAPARETNGMSHANAPLCDVCGSTGRLGKDGKSYYCPDKDAHGGKWYTITRKMEEADLPL